MKYYLITINIISFILYGIDKYNAIHKKYRISEKNLLLLSVLGGMVGAIISMKLFHHKTHKWYFIFINILSLLFYIFLLVLFYNK